jgi:hypothetical protein
LTMYLSLLAHLDVPPVMTFDFWSLDLYLHIQRCLLPRHLQQKETGVFATAPAPR